MNNGDCYGFSNYRSLDCGNSKFADLPRELADYKVIDNEDRYSTGTFTERLFPRHYRRVLYRLDTVS